MSKDLVITILAMAAVLVVLVFSGYAQIDGNVDRRTTAASLENQERCRCLELEVKNQTRLVLTRTDACSLRVGRFDAGDLIRIEMWSPDGPQQVLVRAGKAEAQRIEVGRHRDQYKVVTAEPGTRLVLRRLEADAGKLLLTRVSTSNTVGYASGVIEAYLLHDHHRTGTTAAGAGLATLAAGALLVLLLAWLRLGPKQADLGRELRAALPILVPSAVLLGLLELAGRLTPYHLAYPARTYLVLVVMPVLVMLVLRLPRARTTTVESSALPQPATLIRMESWSRQRFLAIVCAALLTAVAVWIVLLPRSPHEGDEARFLYAIEKYDVSQHSPHPPGYPVYVAVSAAFATAVGPVRGTQLASVLGAVLALLASGLTMRRLGAGRSAVLLGGVLLAAVPAFAFYANVGLSDMLGTGLAAVATLALVCSIEEPDHRWSLQIAAAAVAVTLGVRPQLVLVVAVAGVWAVLRAVKARRWRQLGEALLAGVVTSLLCWGPAVALTGWNHFLVSVRNQSASLLAKEAHLRLPGAPTAEIFDHWFRHPFGSGVLAAAFWTLVVVGAVAWWRAGRRRLVIIAVAGGGGYLLAVMWTLAYVSSVRYILPSLPLLAVLASGIVVLRRPRLRRLVLGMALLLAGLQLVWAAPAHLLRARQAAPVWAALSWVAENADPATTQVVCLRPILPQAKYLLQRATITTTISWQPEAEPAQKPVVWEAFELPPSDRRGRALLYRAAWRCGPLQQLTRNRYNSCVILERRVSGSPASCEDAGADTAGE